MRLRRSSWHAQCKPAHANMQAQASGRVAGLFDVAGSLRRGTVLGPIDYYMLWCDPETDSSRRPDGWVRALGVRSGSGDVDREPGRRLVRAGLGRALDRGRRRAVRTWRPGRWASAEWAQPSPRCYAFRQSCRRSPGHGPPCSARRRRTPTAAPAIATVTLAVATTVPMIHVMSRASRLPISDVPQRSVSRAACPPGAAVALLRVADASRVWEPLTAGAATRPGRWPSRPGSASEASLHYS